MTQRVIKGSLHIDKLLYDFVNEEAIPDSGISEQQFWYGFDQIVTDLAPLNRILLKKRDLIQQQIDLWHLERTSWNTDEYAEFLKSIGYLQEEEANVKISTQNVDDEIAVQSGPQLVVPVTNARYALNAANARWGSLYDAYYGSDAIEDSDGAEKTNGYNPKRGAKVIAKGKELLDTAAPLASASHAQVTEYKIVNGALVAKLESGAEVALQEPEKFAGFLGDIENPTSILLKNNGLHIEIQLDRENPVGKQDLAGVKDLYIEAAVTTIMDFEDSVAAVDAEDKVVGYRNLLGLMRGTLSATFDKNGKSFERTMNPDRVYKTTSGADLTLRGRSLMFIRHVGLLMTNPAILDDKGREIPEGIMDAMIASLIAKHEVDGNTSRKNSSTGSIYVVKPKMHGPEEVEFSDILFSRVEEVLGLPHATLKMGIMDEERRTTVNLKNCISKVKSRCVFINTGFLDRTGDEIHTAMYAGPVLPKGEIKNESWIKAYENWNVDIGLECGLRGKAQIGKGMWAMPDLMKGMLEQKIGHPKAGASTAWVPSPTAATLHALHYHIVDVRKVQDELASRPRASLADILTPPMMKQKPSAEEIKKELENNAQGILGYVVRWIDQGVGCSKVPDINDIGLMEDRATLRISSQHMVNWLFHGICTEEEVVSTMQEMAKIVDAQNAEDPFYTKMYGNFDKSIAFKGALDLVIKGKDQPNGYTEIILNECRKARKKELRGE